MAWPGLDLNVGQTRVTDGQTPDSTYNNMMHLGLSQPDSSRTGINALLLNLAMLWP